jgi:rod shape-determining protein MreD
VREPNPGLALYSFVGISVFFALLVAVFPIARDYSLLRPELVCLVILYWVMYAPEHMGVSVAFFTGWLQDIVEGSIWGAHALALAILAYIGLVSYQRIRNYSVWHQALWVVVLVGSHQVLVNWVQGLAGYQSPVAYMLVPTIISALCWPLVCYALNRLRNYYRLL